MSSPRTSSPASTCLRSPARRWTGSRSGRRTCRAGSRSSIGSRPGSPPSGRSSPARRWRSRRAARSPKARTRSYRSSVLSRKTTRSRSWSRSPWERTCGRLAATFARASRCSPPARVLGAAQIGALAAAGATEVSCARRPVVAVLSTGTELRPPGEPLGPGQIYESNGPMLAAAFEAAGARRRGRCAPVLDDEEAHRARSHRASSRTSSSPPAASRWARTTSSARILAELGVEEDFWGVAVRPGKPLAFGTHGGDARLRACRETPSRRSSGSSSSCGRPCWRSRVVTHPGPHYERGRLASPLRQNDKRDELARARRSARTKRPCSSRSPARSPT